MKTGIESRSLFVVRTKLYFIKKGDRGAFTPLSSLDALRNFFVQLKPVRSFQTSECYRTREGLFLAMAPCRGKKAKNERNSKKKSASARRFFLPFFLTAEPGPRLAFFKPSMQIENSAAWNKKKATANLSGELSKTRYSSSRGGKKAKTMLINCVKRTAKEATNTNHRLTQPCSAR